MNENETPETDAAWRLYYNDDMSEDGDPWGLASRLERRLTIEKNRAEEMGKLAHKNACEAMECRRLLTIAHEALKKLDNWLMRDAQRKQIIEQALTITTPKP